MPIAVTCECGKTYKVGDENAGKKFRCKECEAVVRVPAVEAAPDDDFDLGDDFGSDYGGDEFASDEDYPERPASPKKKSSSGGKKKSKAGGKKSAAKSKKGGGKRGGKDMSPGVKYGIAGGIVFVTTAIIVGILVARGVIGGGNSKSTEGNVSSDDDPAANMKGPMGPGDGNPGGGNPGGGNPGGNPNGGNANGGRNANAQGVALSWRPYANPTAGYEVLMPGEPKKSTQDVVGPNGAVTSTAHAVKLEDDRVFGVVDTDLPAGPNYRELRTANTFFSRLSTTLAVSQRGGSTKRVPLKLGSYHGAEFRVSGSDGTKVLIRVFIVGNRLFQVAATWKSRDTVVPADATKFVKSFKVQGMTAVAANTKTGGKTGTKTAGKKKPASVAVKTAADFLSEFPAGQLSEKDKTFRISGTVSKGWNQGWIILAGDGTRTVACKFAAPPRSAPNVGEPIVVEGTLAANTDQYISLLNCKLAPATTAKKSGGTNALPSQLTAADLIKRFPVGQALPKSKPIRVKGTVSKEWNQGWIILTGDGRRNVGCKFNAAPSEQPTAGDAVIIEGVPATNNGQFITLTNCRIVPATDSSDCCSGSGDGCCDSGDDS